MVYPIIVIVLIYDKLKYVALMVLDCTDKVNHVKEEGWTGFSEGWQGCSKGFPEGKAQEKFQGAALPA